jgi:hypothetical protein
MNEYRPHQFASFTTVARRRRVRLARRRMATFRAQLAEAHASAPANPETPRGDEAAQA